MTRWIDVANQDELGPGMRKIVEVDDDTRIMVINLKGEYYAIESLCTHAMFELDDADIEGENIVCPLHGAHFCIKTGKVLSAPAYEDLVKYDVRVENNMIQVQVDAENNSLGAVDNSLG